MRGSGCVVAVCGGEKVCRGVLGSRDGAGRRLCVGTLTVTVTNTGVARRATSISATCRSLGAAT